MGATALITAIIVGKVAFGWGVEYAKGQETTPGIDPGREYVATEVLGETMEKDDQAEREQQLTEITEQARKAVADYEREQAEAGNKVYAPYSAEHEDEFLESTRYLMTRKELNLVQVFGVLGNVAQESKFNPTLDNVRTKGLIQYEDSRRESLIAFMNEFGYTDPHSVEGQLRFIFWEHQNDSYERQNLEAFRKTTTVADATSTFCSKYERPGMPETEKRVYYANKLLVTVADQNPDLLAGYIAERPVK